MWLADVVYVLYGIVCFSVAGIYGTFPTDWGLLILLTLLWVFVTIIYAEYHNG